MKYGPTEIVHKRRSRLRIIAEILAIAKDGSLKTHMMYAGNLSFAQLNTYLSFLLKITLLEEETRNEKTIYKTTSRGIKYLESYREITNLLTKEARE